jgi:perosamine synthetase
VSNGLSFTWPPMGPAQHDAVTACLTDGDLSLPFGATARLEQAVGDYLGVRHVVAHANGTSAMLSALHAVGVGPGDEVICPAYTGWASIAPVWWLGGQVVFCDIDPDDLVLDLDDLLARVTQRTRAVVVPHLWGAAAPVAELVQWARPRGIAVVEDASHVFGTTADGRHLGTIGDVGVFSMQAQKALPAGEGGLLVTDCTALHDRSLAVGHYERLPGTAAHGGYAGTGLGLNFRISPLNAALAASYLPGLADLLRHQDDLVNALLAPMLDTCRVRATGRQPHVRHGGRTALRLVLPPDCPVETVARLLTDVGLPSEPDHVRPLHRAPLFADAMVGAPLTVTDDVTPRLLHVTIPAGGSIPAATDLGTAAAAALHSEGLGR